MDELHQLTLFVAIMGDATGRGKVTFHRWNPVTGRPVASGTLPTADLPELAQTIGALLGEHVAIGTISTKPADPAPAPRTRVQLCGCVYDSASGESITACRQHVVAP